MYEDKSLHTANFRVNQYKQIVQKIINLNAAQKIAMAHTDLGRLINGGRSRGGEHLFGDADIQELLRKLDGYKLAAATLEGEVETLKSTQPPADISEGGSWS